MQFYLQGQDLYIIIILIQWLRLVGYTSNACLFSRKSCFLKSTWFNVFVDICRYLISHGRELTTDANARRTSWMSGGWVNLMTIAGPTQGTLFGDGWASFRIHQVCSSSIMLKIMLTFNCLTSLDETSIAELHYHCSNCCSAPILMRTRLTIPLVAESSMFVLRP